MALSVKERNKGRAAVIAAALLWGLAGVCVKSISWNAMSLMAARSVISLIMLFAIKGSFRLKLTKSNLLGGFFSGSTGILYVLAIKLTTAGTAIVLQYIAPILVFLFAVIFQKRKTVLWEWLLTLLVFIGCVLSFADHLDPTRIAGNILGLASGFTFAGQIITMNHPDSDSEDCFIIGNLMGFLICLPFVFFDNGLVFNFNNIFWVLVLGIFQYGMANILFGYGIKRVDKIEGSLLLTLEPIFNPIPVAILCNERMGTLAILGSATVILGVTLYSLFSR